VRIEHVGKHLSKLWLPRQSAPWQLLAAARSAAAKTQRLTELWAAPWLHVRLLLLEHLLSDHPSGCCLPGWMHVQIIHLAHQRSAARQLLPHHRLARHRHPTAQPCARSCDAYCFDLRPWRAAGQLINARLQVM
jgi:hypothetical protein